MVRSVAANQLYAVISFRMTAARSERFWKWFGAALVPAALLCGWAVYDAIHAVSSAESLARAPNDWLWFGLVCTLAVLAIAALAWVLLLWTATRSSRTPTHQGLCLAQALAVFLAFSGFAVRDCPIGALQRHL